MFYVGGPGGGTFPLKVIGVALPIYVDICSPRPDVAATADSTEVILLSSSVTRPEIYSILKTFISIIGLASWPVSLLTTDSCRSSRSGVTCRDPLLFLIGWRFDALTPPL